MKISARNQLKGKIVAIDYGVTTNHGKIDFGNQVLVLAETRKLAARGTGVILSTHDPDQAFAVASRVALMQDGVIVAQGPPSQVLAAARLKAVYGIDVTVERLAGGQTVCAPVYPR